MLYDPKWDETLLDRFIAFLETKDPNEGYNWCGPESCACGQFYGSRDWIGLPGFARLNSIAQGNGRLDNPSDWTFGKCLERARKYQCEQR